MLPDFSYYNRFGRKFNGTIIGLFPARLRSTFDPVEKDSVELGPLGLHHSSFLQKIEGSLLQWWGKRHQPSIHHRIHLIRVVHLPVLPNHLRGL